MKPYLKILFVMITVVFFSVTWTTKSLAKSTDNNIDSIAEGKQIAFDRKKGNCLACHMIDDGALPGTAGPPLIAMQSRYPDIKKLRVQIWDATIANPNTVMPPFGRHQMLTEKEIDQVVAYIYSL